MPATFPELRLADEESDVAPRLGHRLVDAYLELVAAGPRPNSTLAIAYDGNVVRFSDGSAGLALSTVRRRLSSVSGLYTHLVAVGEVDHNPVQRGMPVRAPVSRGDRVVPLV